MTAPGTPIIVDVGNRGPHPGCLTGHLVFDPDVETFFTGQPSQTADKRLQALVAIKLTFAIAVAQASVEAHRALEDQFKAIVAQLDRRSVG